MTVARLLIRWAVWLLDEAAPKELGRMVLMAAYSPVEIELLERVVQEVGNHPNIPHFEPWAKHGREYRRDEASWQVYQQTGMRHCRVNFGCELVSWLSHDIDEKPRKHHQQIGFDN